MKYFIIIISRYKYRSIKMKGAKKNIIYPRKPARLIASQRFQIENTLG